jgi:hypothetical protein
MNGTDVLNELSRRIRQRDGTKHVTDVVLARELGVTPGTMAREWRDKELTPRKIANLIERVEQRAAKDAVKSVIEFYRLHAVKTKGGGKWRLFRAQGSPHLEKLKTRLDETRGIYIFHDSRGRAIYAGKAYQRSLWEEMNAAFNRDRGVVQSVKRGVKGSIRSQNVALHDIAAYASAYEVKKDMINGLEALIVRAFANDLLNVRMESL